jgi:hypothetical protein
MPWLCRCRLAGDRFWHDAFFQSAIAKATSQSPRSSATARSLRPDCDRPCTVPTANLRDQRRQVSTARNKGRTSANDEYTRKQAPNEKL